MFYEGSEKRLEITTPLNLLTFKDNFWEMMVQQAGAYIISKIENTQVKAFLLSESSLFIWNNRLLLITCGETHLLQAALFFQKNVARQNITSLLFQRHQAFRPDKQKTTFQQDSLQLQQQLKGDSKHWSEDYCGDIFLFGNNSQIYSTKNILMLHELKGPFFDELQRGKEATEVALPYLKLTHFFESFTIDQHSFEPQGYSLNALYKEQYFTLHITPEKRSSYVSFESNLMADEMQPFQQHLIKLLSPQRAYLMTFRASSNNLSIDTQRLS